jgi:GMP synthase PP-ATPase subunit
MLCIFYGKSKSSNDKNNHNINRVEKDEDVELVEPLNQFFES